MSEGTGTTNQHLHIESETARNVDEYVKQADLGPINIAIVNLQNSTQELNKSFEKAKKGVGEHEKKIKLFNENIENINSDLKRAQEKETRIIETLAVFVALFTFISVNIQIFSRISNLMSAIIFLIIMASLTGFILLFSISIIHKDWDKKFTFLLLYTFVILVLGIIANYIFKPELNKIDVNTFSSNTTTLNDLTNKE